MATSSFLSSYGPAAYTPTFGDVSKRKGIQKGIESLSAITGRQMGEAAGQRAGEYGKLMPGYSSLLSSGYSPQEKSGIEQSTLGSINEAYGGAADAARRRLARTGNAAGFNSLLSNLARGKGSALAKQNLINQSAFADEAMRRKMIGLEGISKLYGVDTSFLGGLNDLQSRNLNAAINTYGISSGKKSFGEILGGAFAGAMGQGLGSLFGPQRQGQG